MCVMVQQYYTQSTTTMKDLAMPTQISAISPTLEMALKLQTANLHHSVSMSVTMKARIGYQ